MKNPTIHVTLSDLCEIFKAQGVEGYHAFAVSTLKAAKPYQIKNRYILNTNSKTSKKLKKTINADNPIIEVFNRLLSAIRQEQGHKHIQAIYKADINYVLLKEVAKLAYDFGEKFNIVPRETGYKEFIVFGLKLMGRKYGLNKFKYHVEKIYAAKEAQIAVNGDVDEQGTKQFYEVWFNTMHKYCGRTIDLDSDEKLANMVYGRQEADEKGAHYVDWIEAQFNQLAFLNAIPELSQLYGENAKSRYERYMLKQGKVLTKADDLPSKFNSPAEEIYWKTIRQLRADKKVE